MEDEINPLQQADIILIELQKHRAIISFDDLLKNINHTAIDKDVLSSVLEKLKRDNYVYIKQKHTGGWDYAITVEGFMFIGYVKQAIIETDLACRKNIRDFALTWGTVLAGFAGIGLLIFQIYSYIHPIH